MGYMSIDPNYIPLFNLHLEAVDFFNLQAAKFRHIESIFEGDLSETHKVKPGYLMQCMEAA